MDNGRRSQTEEDNRQLVFTSLPEEIVLRCLSHVPICYHLNLSWVSKTLRSLVISPELNRLRSFLLKKSLYVCFGEGDATNFHWLTLRPIQETTVAYRLVPIPFPSHPFMYGSSAVAVGPEIYFLGPSLGTPFRIAPHLWILDTRSGDFTQGPSMKMARDVGEAGVGVIDGKIYVIGGGGGDGEEIQVEVEVLDPKPRIWEFSGRETMRRLPQVSASLERKVYMVDYERTRVYDPSNGRKDRMVHMVNRMVHTDYNPREGGRKETIERLSGHVEHVCVVDDVLCACFYRQGLMWFDTKLNVWRKLVGRDGNQMYISHVDAMSEYDGKLAVLYLEEDQSEIDDDTRSVWCRLISLHRAGERICGTTEWSGVVATIPYSFRFLHCLLVED